MNNSISPSRWLDFTLALTVRELKGRYKHMALGFAWIMINPLLQMLVIGLIFQFFPTLRTENYFLYLFLGLLPWNFFSASITTGTPLFVHESLIVSLAVSNFFHFSIGLLLVLPFAQASLRFDWLLAASTWLFLFTVGVTLLFSSLNVRFRDIDFLVKAVVPLWFYATPIIYSSQMLPEFAQQILAINPVTPIIELFRAALGVSAAPASQIMLFWPLMITTLVFITGILIFKREEKYFDDWM